MAVHATPPKRVLAGYDAYSEDSEHGYGLVLFAETLLLMLGARPAQRTF